MRKTGSHLTNRIQEFELWRKDGDFFRDGEYAKRRAQRRERLTVLESDKKLKSWKKLYIPAVLGMITGSFLTLASTVHGLGKNTVFWSSRDIFHIIGPLFLVIGLAFLMVTAACSHREEENLRIKLGLPSMFPQKMKTLPSEELTSITTVSDLDSSHSLSDKLGMKSNDKVSLRINSRNLSTDFSETTSFIGKNPLINKSPNRHKESKVLKDITNFSKTRVPISHIKLHRRSFQSGYSIVPELVFELENEMTRVDIPTLIETDIDTYCAMEENRQMSIVKSASLMNYNLLPNIIEKDKSKLVENTARDCHGYNTQHIELKCHKFSQIKSKESNINVLETNISQVPKSSEKSRIYSIHRLSKAKDRLKSSASETSSGYSSGTNLLDTEQLEFFYSEPDGDMIEECS